MMNVVCFGKGKKSDEFKQNRTKWKICYTHQRFDLLGIKIDCLFNGNVRIAIKRNIGKAEYLFSYV